MRWEPPFWRLPRGDSHLAESDVRIRVYTSPGLDSKRQKALDKILAEVCAGANVEAKRKDYGLLITGPRESVDRVVSSIRKIEPNRIFLQEASPPVRGHAVFCDLLQQEGETRVLPSISKALEDSSGESGTELEERKVAESFHEDAIHGSDELPVRNANEANVAYLDYDFRREPEGPRAAPASKKEGPRSRANSIKIFLNPVSQLTPSKLAEELRELCPDIRFKEECYGVLVRGRPARIGALIRQLRAKYPCDTFVRETVARTNRAQVFSGFLQFAGEYPLLPLVSRALRRTRANETDEAARTAGEQSGDRSTEALRVSLERCRFIQPIKTIDFVRINQATGEVPLIRCPRAREGCMWEFHNDCVYGLLEPTPRTKYWFYSSTAYS